MLITEIFESIQGEGTLMGKPMLFVRTNRCNLRCKWCDSEYTFSGGKDYILEVLLAKVAESWTEWVCFTGGEPLIQRDALDFVKDVVRSGKKVLIETGGSMALDDYVSIENTVIDMDVKTPSSQEEKSIHMANLELLRETDYIKFVISDDRDFRYAVDFVRSLKHPLQVVLQPAWGGSLKELVEKAMKERMDVRVLPQLHKMIWGEIPGV